MVGAGAGAADCVVLGSEGDSVVAGAGAADDVVTDEVDVVPAGVEESEPTNFTTANTSSARIAALSTPRATRTAGFWCQGLRGGGGVCP